MQILLTRDPISKRRILLSLFYTTIFNTAVAAFITYVLGIGDSFSANWVFSMLIGFSISTLINGMCWLIWRTNKPHRVALLLLCLICAPLGYYLGVSMGLLIYGREIPDFLSFINYGNRVLLLMCIFISVTAGIFFWNQSRLAELIAMTETEKAHSAAIEKQAMQAQLQLLQAQIEPHMLFNTLANLQGLIVLDPQRAQYMLEQLIVYLRASLSSSRIEKTTLKQEFTLMRAYLELLAIRMGKRLTYQLDLPDELQNTAIAPMLLQPLVENAIKHGLEPKMEGGRIHVDAAKQGGMLQLEVRDTGLGLPFDYDDSKTRIEQQVGNANVRERLLALYGPTASLRLSANQPEGVIAHLTIPLSE